MNRIRLFMIHLFGGIDKSEAWDYIYKHEPQRKVVYTAEHLNPIKLAVNASIPYHMAEMLGIKETERYIRRELANKMCDKMLEDNLIQFYTEDRSDIQSVEARATIFVKGE